MISLYLVLKQLFVAKLDVRGVRIGPQVDQIGSKRDISWTFSDQISVHFGSPDLTHLGLKSDTPDPKSLSTLGLKDFADLLILEIKIMNFL